MTTNQIRTALRQLTVPEPGPELLERILQSRRAGARVTLPRDRALVRGWLAAAALIALIVGIWQVWPSRSMPADSRVAARDPFSALLRGTMLWPAPGVAQETHGAAPAPKYPLVLTDTLDPKRLVEGVWSYTATVTTDDILTQPSGRRRIRMARSAYEGRQAWMANTERGMLPYSGWKDTTYLDAASLRPLYAVARANKDRTRFEQSFSDDSARESIEMRGPIQRSWHGAIAFSFPHNAFFINDWSTNRLAAVLPALRLTRDWRGTLYQVAFVSWTWVRSVAPIDLRVVGTDRVTVPAGTFDCWRIEVETHLRETERSRVWVSRENGWVIKQEHRGSDTVINEVLESFKPLQ